MLLRHKEISSPGLTTPGTINLVSDRTIRGCLRRTLQCLKEASAISLPLLCLTSRGSEFNKTPAVKSYFLQFAYTDENTLVKALTFGGHEKTYQAWYGLSADELVEDRKQNPYTYENEIDNYKQNHFQVH